MLSLVSEGLEKYVIQKDRKVSAGIIKFPILGDQRRQIYGNLEGFPLC